MSKRVKSERSRTKRAARMICLDSYNDYGSTIGKAICHLELTWSDGRKQKFSAHLALIKGAFNPIWLLTKWFIKETKYTISYNRLPQEKPTILDREIFHHTSTSRALIGHVREIRETPIP